MLSRLFKHLRAPQPSIDRLGTPVGMLRVNMDLCQLLRHEFLTCFQLTIKGLVYLLTMPIDTLWKRLSAEANRDTPR